MEIQVTTPDQSSMLMVLGFDPRTSDFYYDGNVLNIGNIFTTDEEGLPIYDESKDGDQPAWSVGALMNLYPKTITDKYDEDSADIYMSVEVGKGVPDVVIYYLNGKEFIRFHCTKGLVTGLVDCLHYLAIHYNFVR
jgi:hypothetical protein